MKQFALFIGALCALAIPALAQTYGNGTWWANGTTADENTSLRDFINTVIDTSTNKTLITSAQFAQVAITPIITSGTYGQSLCIGGTLSLTNPVRSAGAGLEIKTILVVENNSGPAKLPINFLFFDEPNASLTGTYNDRAPIGISPADLTHLVRSIPVTSSNYIVIGGTNIATADVAVSNEPIVSGTAASFSMVAVVTGTSPLGTSGTNTETFKVIFNKD